MCLKMNDYFDLFMIDLTQLAQFEYSKLLTFSIMSSMIATTLPKELPTPQMECVFS